MCIKVRRPFDIEMLISSLFLFVAHFIWIYFGGVRSWVAVYLSSFSQPTHMPFSIYFGYFFGIHSGILLDNTSISSDSSTNMTSTSSVGGNSNVSDESSYKHTYDEEAQTHTGLETETETETGLETERLTRYVSSECEGKSLMLQSQSKDISGAGDGDGDGDGGCNSSSSNNTNANNNDMSHPPSSENKKHDSNPTTTSTCQVTVSNYSWLMRLITFDQSLHCEHHDFPKIPCHLLGRLRHIAPEFYDEPAAAASVAESRSQESIAAATTPSTTTSSVGVQSYHFFLSPWIKFMYSDPSQYASCNDSLD